MYSGYGEKSIPLKSYGLLLGLYVGLLTGVFLIAKRADRKRRKPVAFDPSVQDLAMLTIATHEASLILTRDAVASSIRAPFTRFEKDSGEGEIDEKPRGSGLRLAIGELLTCPYCAEGWMSGGLFSLYLFKPREARFVASILCAMAGSSFLHNGYQWIQNQADGSEIKAA